MITCYESAANGDGQRHKERRYLVASLHGSRAAQSRVMKVSDVMVKFGKLGSTGQRGPSRELPIQTYGMCKNIFFVLSRIILYLTCNHIPLGWRQRL